VTAVDLKDDLPSITHPLTIAGPGADSLNVRRSGSASGAFPLFPVGPSDSTSTVTIRGVTMSGAVATGFAGGAVGKFGPGGLVLDSVVISGNSAAVGPAVFFNQGQTTISNSTLTDNHSTFSGGAIAAQQASPGVTGTATVVNSTIEGNSSPEFGGAVFIQDGTDITILSSTIVQNTANDDNNTSGDAGGIYNNSSTVAIANTILAGNTVGPGASSSDGQCAGEAFTSSGFNLRSADDPGCSGFNATGDIVNATPMLGTLGDNGGPTPTIALLTSSPAINAGNSDSPIDGFFPTCPTADQRGVSRLGDNRCDIGAFEKRSPTNTTLACSPTTLILGSGSSTCTATVTDLAGLNAPTGNVSFKTDASGEFSGGAVCPLSGSAEDSSSCSVTYTPAAIGTHTIGAFYDGTPDLADSDDSEGISVGTTPASIPPGPSGTTFDLKAAIKKCKKKFPKGPKRKKCIKRAKKRAQA
jgi:predicted outer membrane repeat protein